MSYPDYLHDCNLNIYKLFRICKSYPMAQNKDEVENSAFTQVVNDPSGIERQISNLIASSKGVFDNILYPTGLLPATKMRECVSTH